MNLTQEKKKKKAKKKTRAPSVPFHSKDEIRERRGHLKDGMRLLAQTSGVRDPASVSNQVRHRTGETNMKFNP